MVVLTLHGDTQDLHREHFTNQVNEKGCKSTRWALHGTVNATCKCVYFCFVDEKCSFCSLRDIVPMFPGLQQAKVSVWAPAPSFWEVFFFFPAKLHPGVLGTGRKAQSKTFC